MGTILRWPSDDDDEWEGSLPAVPSMGQMELALAMQEAKQAMEGIAEITRLIAKLAPSDPDTYAQLLRIRAAYVSMAEQRIARHRRWY